MIRIKESLNDYNPLGIQIRDIAIEVSTEMFKFRPKHKQGDFLGFLSTDAGIESRTVATLALAL
jgi:hypothetical protein